MTIDVRLIAVILYQSLFSMLTKFYIEAEIPVKKSTNETGRKELQALKHQRWQYSKVALFSSGVNQFVDCDQMLSTKNIFPMVPILQFTI